MSRARKLKALEDRFQTIARSLDPSVLSGEGDDFDDLEDIIYGQLSGAGDNRLLGFYSESGVLAAYEAYGLLDELRGRGYADFRVEFNLEEFAHRLRFFADGESICDCVLRKVAGAEDPCIAELQRHRSFQLLYVEWLELEDPRGQFTPQRPQLPGQTHPGSGLGEEVFLLLSIAGQRLNFDGLLEVPQYFHNAAFYGRRAHFIDPHMQGRFMALLRLLEDHPLAEVAWGLEEGRVRDVKTGEVIEWPPREQLVPFSKHLHGYFESSAWRQAAHRAWRQMNLTLVASQ
ncbi:MAG: hypothetical protein ACE366_22565 [Bradymonadia bacterium]